MGMWVLQSSRVGESERTTLTSGPSISMLGAEALDQFHHSPAQGRTRMLALGRNAFAFHKRSLW